MQIIGGCRISGLPWIRHGFYRYQLLVVGLDDVPTVGFVPNLIQLGLCRIRSVCVVGDMVVGWLVRSWPMGVVWFVVVDWFIKGARRWCVVLSFGRIWDLGFDFSFSVFSTMQSNQIIRTDPNPIWSNYLDRPKSNPIQIKSNQIVEIIFDQIWKQIQICSDRIRFIWIRSDAHP